MTFPEPRWKLAVKSSVASLLGLAVLGHFGITAAYVAPPSPLKLKMQPVFTHYVEPYFAQRWELFAPDPVMDTRLLMVSCRVHKDDGTSEDTAYSNMTTPLREMKNTYRLTPADRIDRIEQGAIHMMFDRPDALSKKLLDIPADQAGDGIQEARAAYLEEETARRARGVRLLTRVASAECDRLYGAGRTSDVHVRMAVLKPPPFSERNHPPAEPVAEYTEFDWATYQPVAPL